MIVLHTQDELHQFLSTLLPSQTIGFVPTMGALHAGHLSLLTAAAEQDDVVICSIFVNPTQFNESSDFDSYPQVLVEDTELLKKVKVDVIFAPKVSEIYPEGTAHIPHYDIGEMDYILEGEHRPGHFQGVCHIIQIFLEMIKPTHIYMGEKDFQQAMVVQRLINLKGHNTILVPCTTLREPSGLAMSSRNRLLSAEATARAAALNKALNFISEHSATHSFESLKMQADEMLEASGFEPEYIALCEAASLAELENFDHTKNMRLIAAAFIEGVRLIDNIAVDVKK